MAVGYGDNEDLAVVRGAGSYSIFAGQTVASNCVLIKMTRGADSTLDGVVDAQDVTTVGAHYLKPNSGQWAFGDFDYSGTCDATDVTTLGSTFGATGPALSPALMETNATRSLPAWMQGFTSLVGPAPDGDLEFTLTTDGTGQLDVSWTDVLLDYRQWAQYGSSDPIDWSTVTNVSYRVRFTTDVNWGSFSRVILNADVTSTSLTGLASNTTHYVRVVALSPAGNVLSGVEDATTA